MSQKRFHSFGLCSGNRRHNVLNHSKFALCCGGFAVIFCAHQSVKLVASTHFASFFSSPFLIEFFQAPKAALRLSEAVNWVWLGLPSCRDLCVPCHQGSHAKAAHNVWDHGLHLGFTKRTQCSLPKADLLPGVQQGSNYTAERDIDCSVVQAWVLSGIPQIKNTNYQNTLLLTHFSKQTN